MLICIFKNQMALHHLVVINNQAVEIVQQKFLVTVIYNKLIFESHVALFAGKPINGCISSANLRVFYLPSLSLYLLFPLFADACCLPSETDCRALLVCSKIAGMTLNDLSNLYKVRTLKKAQLIVADSNYPSFKELR